MLGQRAGSFKRKQDRRRTHTVHTRGFRPDFAENNCAIISASTGDARFFHKFSTGLPSPLIRSSWRSAGRLPAHAPPSCSGFFSRMGHARQLWRVRACWRTGDSSVPVGDGRPAPAPGAEHRRSPRGLGPDVGLRGRGRARHYAKTRGESDFALLTGQVTAALNDIALNPDPAAASPWRRRPGGTLRPGPGQTSATRPRRFGQLVSILDDVIAEMRVDAGPGIDFALVAMTEPPPAVA